LALGGRAGRLCERGGIPGVFMSRLGVFFIIGPTVDRDAAGLAGCSVFTGQLVVVVFIVVTIIIVFIVYNIGAWWI